MSDRGMKKWLAYRSLVEQNPSNENNYAKREKIEKPLISQDEAENINNILTKYEGETLIVLFYRNGKIFEEEIIIKKIDLNERKLVLTNRRVIHFSEIVNLRIK
jgi:hypothetical protein